MSEGERRLAAIMFTDMVGYTALGQRNESLSLALVGEQRRLIRPILVRHNGREIKTIGDGFLVEFASALDSVNCAYDIQRATREFNIPIPADRRIHLRVGIHLGDVIEIEGDIGGDAVNVASRIEPLAEDGGVCITHQLYEQIVNKIELAFTSLGNKSLKNVSVPVEVYKMVMPWSQTTAEGNSAPANRIAVLPFTSFGADPQDDYFSDGMTEEVISTLSKVKGLEVISRTSVMLYKKTPKAVREVSRELGAGMILEGSVRKAGNRLRVTVQMIDAMRDTHLWVESYDRDYQDVFAIQGDIAGQVADALKVRVLPGERTEIAKRPTGSTSAYTLYLLGRYLWNQRGGEKGVENVKKARQCFEEAVSEDPLFALGYVGQADCYLVQRGDDLTMMEADLEKAQALVAKALDLDPSLAEAHATKGLVLMDGYQPRQAEAEFKRAVELKPSYATAHQWYSYIFFHQQKWEAALAQVEKAMELDPLSPMIILNQAHMYYHMKDYGRALDLFKRAAALEPALFVAHWYIAAVHGYLQMFDDMKHEFAIVSDLIRSRFPLVKTREEADCAYFMHDVQTIRRLLPEIEAHYHEASLSAWNVAKFFFRVGDNDRGFEWFERSYSSKEDVLLELKCDQDLDGVRNDPRFGELLRKVGLD